MSKKNSYNIVKLVNLKLVKEEAFRNYSSISSDNDVMKLMHNYMANQYREIAYVIGLDNRNRPTVIHCLGVGSISSCNLPVSSVIKPLLLSNCSGAILVHNHPSDYSDYMVASNADITITQKVKEALKLFEMELIDHIIFNSDATQTLSMRSTINW